MWVMVYFDLPVETKLQRKHAAGFRKALIKDGFDMFQFSIYTRCCSSRENAEVHRERVKQLLPSDGFVAIICLTDKQFGMMHLYRSASKVTGPEVPKQLEIF